MLRAEYMWNYELIAIDDALPSRSNQLVVVVERAPPMNGM